MSSEEPRKRRKQILQDMTSIEIGFPASSNNMIHIPDVFVPRLHLRQCDQRVADMKCSVPITWPVGFPTCSLYIYETLRLPTVPCHPVAISLLVARRTLLLQKLLEQGSSLKSSGVESENDIDQVCMDDRIYFEHDLAARLKKGAVFRDHNAKNS